MASNRYNGNVVPFADNATGSNRTVFGDTNLSDNIDDNLNDDYKLGWEIVGINDSPTKQDFNALGYTQGKLISHLYQQGISEYNAAQEYYVNSLVMGNNGVVYQSLSGTEGSPNVGNDPTTDDANWKLQSGTGTYVIDTVDDFGTVPNGIDTVIVKDTNRGGVFVSKTEVDTDPNTGSLYAVNSGTVFAKSGGGFWVRQYDDFMNISWFGAVGDTTNGTDGVDNTTPFNAAILAISKIGGGTVTINTGNYAVRGTVVIPSTVFLNLNNSYIYGNGLGATNDLFQSGTIVNGNIESNIGKPHESALATKMGISNGTIFNTGKALNLYNCIWQTEFKDLEFINCTWAMYVSRCFYSRFINLISRGTAGFTTNAAFDFTGVVNVQQMESIQVTDRILGMRIAGGANGLGLYNCSAESCGTGVKVESTTGPITFNSCYYELNTVVGVDVNTVEHKNSVTFIGCFFNDNSNGEGTAIGIRGNAGGVGTHSSIIVDRSCYFQSNNVDIDCSSNSYYNQDVIEYSQIGNSSFNTLPVFPSKIKAGLGTNVNIFQNAQDGSTSAPTIKSKIHGDSLIPFNYEGSAGTQPVNQNGFIARTVDNTVPIAIIVYLDTELDVTNAGMFVYNITIGDTQNVYRFQGFIFGVSTTSVVVFPTATAVGKTITANVVAGKLQIQLDAFNGAANTAAAIRHI